MHRTRILFYVPEGNVLTNGVYASQCLGLARYLVESRKAECAILQYAPKGEELFIGGALARKWARGKRMIREAFSSDSFIEKQTLEPGITLYSDFKTRRVISLFRTKRFFVRVASRATSVVNDFNPTHIYCRSYTTAPGASLIAKAYGAKLIYSIRGEDVSEKRCAGGFYNWLVSFWVRRSVRQAIHLANHINTVSKAFRIWLNGEYGCDASVVPCCVTEEKFTDDHSRDAVRAELGFTETNKVLVYCGGMWPWLCVDDMVLTMKRMCDSCGDLKVLFIVKDEQSVRDVCSRVGFASEFWRVHGCKPTEVGRYMRAGDAGIILLRGDLRDQVCSPIKVGEYLASGLGVIAPACTGDFAKDARDKSFFCEYSKATDIERYARYISSRTEKDRDAARQFAKDNYTWSSNAEEIDKMLRK